LLIVPTPTDKTIQKRERQINIKNKNMKRISFIMGLVALLSVCVTSCKDEYGNGVTVPQPSEKTDHTPQPTTDSLGWKQAIRKYFKVEPTADVTSVIIGQRNNGDLDSLILKYKYVYSLAADTTLYLESAPTGDLGYSTAADRTDYSEYSHNMQGDSVCFINYAKPYYLSNGVNLSLKTQRVRGYHMMGGQPIMYSEPTQSVARLQIEGSTDEFERNDSIFGRRINTCSVELTLGGQRFVPSCTVTEIWFKAIKEKPEPQYNVYVNEAVSHIASSMVEISKNNWKNVHLMVGKTQLHAIVCTTDSHNDKVVGVEDKPVALSRVVVNNQVNSAIYDSQTGLYTTSLITPDNGGWSWEGFIDGREIVNDLGNQQAIEEGIKNFMESNTSKPTPFFSGVSAKVTATWHEFSYTTITWVKYSKEGKAVTNQIVVKHPTK
jgi:hypothetical protein